MSEIWTMEEREADCDRGEYIHNFEREWNVFRGQKHILVTSDKALADEIVNSCNAQIESKKFQDGLKGIDFKKEYPNE